VNVQYGTVGIERPIQRRYRRQLQPVLHVLTEAIESVGDEIGHRQHGGAGVDAVLTRRSLQLHLTGSATGVVVALENRDRATGARESHRRREARKAGTDDHHVVRRPRNGSRTGPRHEALGLGENGHRAPC